MSFRTSPPPRLEDYGGNVSRWAVVLADWLSNQGRDLETESLARERATSSMFTITNLGTSGTMSLDATAATLAEVRFFLGALIDTLQQRRLVKASVS